MEELSRNLTLSKHEYVAIKMAINEFYHNISKPALSKGEESIPPYACKVHAAAFELNMKFQGKLRW